MDKNTTKVKNYVSRKLKIEFYWSILEKGMFSLSEQPLVGRECGIDIKNGCEGDCSQTY
jgi:hypothetical protein